MIRRLVIGFACAGYSACSAGTAPERAFLYGQNAACDQLLDSSGPPQIPAPGDRRIVAPPLTLDMTISLADGVAPPGHGRVALVVALPLPYREDPKQELHVFEYGTTALPPLPGHVSLALLTPPQDVLDIARAWSSDPGPNGPHEPPTVVSAQLVVYDDANGTGHMDIDPHAGLDQLESSSASADANGWGASKFVLWYGEFGAGNEMISLDTISASFADATGEYTLMRESGGCNPHNGSRCCASQLVPFSQGLVVDWPR
jgi:hypothetical protein